MILLRGDEVVLLSLPLPLSSANEPGIEAIAERVRAVVARQPGHCLDVIADALAVARDQFRSLIEERGRLIDRSFLLDVIAALVYHAGIDPNWLLTGEYDSSTHRKALLLGEDRTPGGVGALRELVTEQYRELRNRATFFGFLSRSISSRTKNKYASR